VNAGFTEVTMEPTRIYQGKDIRGLLAGSSLDADSILSQVEGKFASAFIRARKAEKSCCEPDSGSCCRG
jgi:arsenite methyltransferase